jgi:hypothetical protein
MLHSDFFTTSELWDSFSQNMKKAGVSQTTIALRGLIMHM